MILPDVNILIHAHNLDPTLHQGGTGGCRLEADSGFLILNLTYSLQPTAYSLSSGFQRRRQEQQGQQGSSFCQLVEVNEFVLGVGAAAHCAQAVQSG